MSAPLPPIPLTGAALALAAGVAHLPVSALLTLPTGAGKTWLALQAARETLRSGDRVLVLTPLRALTAEVQAEWSAALPGFQVAHYTRDTRPRTPYAAADVIIMTPERLDLLSRSWRRHHAWLARLRLIVADEVHLIADPSRGARLDAALTRLRALLPLVRVLALTATCGNPLEVARWLGAIHVGGGERPVPLTWTVRQVHSARDKPAALAALLLPGEPTLVFVHSRARAAELAQQLRTRGQAAEAHHAGLGPEARAAAESRFRAGETTILTATPTLELGLNLPCRHVVLYDLTLIQDGHFIPLGINAAWQRAGRAGRIPGEGSARVTVMGTAREEPERYTRPDFEPLQSPLAREDGTLDFLLGSLDGGFCRTRSQAARLLGQTFAAMQGPLDAQVALDSLLRHGALEEHEGRLTVTLLGRIASQALLPVATVKMARSLPDDPTVLDVFLLLCALQQESMPRTSGAVTTLLEAALQLTPSRLLDAREIFSPDVLLGAALLCAACGDGDEETAAAYDLYAPQVTALRESALRVVTAWAAFRPDLPKLSLVRTMLATQLGLGHATLALLPGVGAATARRLAHAGLEDVEALALATPEVLVMPGLSPARAEQLVRAAEGLVKALTHDPTREPPAGERMPWPLDWQGRTDPLRLRRAQSLQVEQMDGGYRVTGGAEPHQVSPELTCDCLDHTRTRRCKHVLAVLLRQGDPELHRNAEVLC